ncbi:hypothetical protein [Sinomicrobium weinanense]|uniref:Uncharacterized protein n=1 Tax=Sinomicrobium weinanense TaxID=2842200 RepID=A0A926JVC6_9FLAO|nr:hypothetical protein [Sinomicrobium weinanense]MBC9798270.1 hypothetical protein [Sinomicrobium weinanense]MBU3125336.1 hypothetical protein [Sinomicrobium weinanense]
MDKHQQQHTNTKFLPNIKEAEIQAVFKDYEQLVKCYRWIRISGLLMIAIIGGYNFFIAGKRYTISEHNNIQNTMVFILGSIVLGLLVIAIVVLKRQGAVRKQIRGIAQKYNFPYREFKKEFNIALKSFYGGSGV